MTEKCRLWLNALPPLPTAAEMRAWDAASIALGIPEIVLMENAAHAALGVLRTEMGDLNGVHILLLMGHGNNGGDAACLSRLLLGAKALPLVLHTRPLRGYTGSTGRHVRAARACGVPFFALGAQPARSFAMLTSQTFAPNHPFRAWAQATLLVDGLLGTGFRGSLRPVWAELVQAVNLWSQEQHRRVLALDIPSGLHSGSGQASPHAIRAQATVSFQAAKPGLYMPTAHAFTGRLHAVDIGIPPCAQDSAPPSFRLLQLESASPAALFPPPAPESFKNSYGHVLVVGGSPGLTGAAHLAARAALRCGAGLVSVAAPASLCSEIKDGLPDIMTLPLPTEIAGQWPDHLPPALTALALRCSVLVIGPGMGRQAAAFVQALLRLSGRPPAIIDADALYALAPDALNTLSPQDILTPHPGEAAALLQRDSHAIQAKRLESLHALCALAPAVWILKGAGTLIGQRGHCTLLSPHAVPALAVGGTGDVLSGCIAALLGRLRTAGGKPAPAQDVTPNVAPNLTPDAAPNVTPNVAPHVAPDASPHAPASSLAPAPAPHSPAFSSLAAAALGVCIHAEAGNLLASRYPQRGNLASQVAEALPQAMHTIL